MANLNKILANIVFEGLNPVIQRPDGLYQSLFDYEIYPSLNLGTDLRAGCYDMTTDDTKYVIISGTWDSTRYGYYDFRWMLAENIPSGGSEPLL